MALNKSNEQITILLCITILICALCSNVKEASAFSSQTEYENAVTDGNGLKYLKSLDTCSNKIMPWADFTYNVYNVVMRSRMSENPSISTDDRVLITFQIYGPIIARAALYSTLFNPMTVFMSGGVSGIVGLLAISSEILVMFDICTNMYIIQPHEYVNMSLGGELFMKEEKVDGQYINNAPCAATTEEVPYFFQCTDSDAYGYDPDLCSEYTLIGSENADTCTCKQYPGRTGYVKPPKYCYAQPGKVGMITFAYDSDIMSRFWTSRTRYSPMHGTKFVKPNGGS